MRLREELESLELARLDKRACKSSESEGRLLPETPCDYRTDFQRDRDRILHSKSFRRLMHKTQVFLAPEDDHYRTRLTHTLEVSQVARTVARSLNYNEDLTEAIALGHDLGHTPFGHSGERVLNRIHPGGFRHNEQSLRVCDRLEETPGRTGLNLTREVRDGILHHRGPVMPSTLEGRIVRICDRIAYINHDIDDAIRSGVLREADLPDADLEVLGRTHTLRIHNLIVDLVRNSEGRDDILLSEPFRSALDDLRSFMMHRVYRGPEILAIEEHFRVGEVIEALYRFYLAHPSELPGLYASIAEEEGIHAAAKDYVSCMTDRYALSRYRKLINPDGAGLSGQEASDGDGQPLY